MADKTIVIRSRVQPVNAGSFDAKRDGDVVHNAIYDRNKQIANWLGCAIRVEEFVGNTNNNSLYNEIQDLADVPMYHIVTTATHKMARLAVEGMLHDLASQQYIDLNQSHYDKNYNDALNVGGRQYLLSGKLTISWYRYQVVTFFNRNLFKEYNVDLPYETVLNHEWTLAKMCAYANEFYNDLNCNGLYDEDDQYGYYLFVGDSSSQTDGFMSAFNLRMVTKDADGYYVSEKIDIVSWTNTIGTFLTLIDTSGCYASRNLSNAAIEQKFTSQEAAMITYSLYAVESDYFVALSRTKEGCGILPLPMTDENQEDYISYVQSEVLSLGIPYSMKGDDLLSATVFLEAYAYVSYNTTVPAYYEKALTKKYVIDERSKGMLKIIDSNVIVDPVNMYGRDYFNFNASTLRPVYSGDASISHLLSTQVLNGSFENCINSLNQTFKKLDEKLIMQGYPNSGAIAVEK